MKGSYSVQKTFNRIHLNCRVITMAASEKFNIVADSKIAKKNKNDVYRNIFHKTYNKIKT